MADIKRLHYFTEQFLQEEDFNDEQAYHLEMRRRHNLLLHDFGVAQGMEVEHVVERDGEFGVRVSAGFAIDPAGREIVLLEPRLYTLETRESNIFVYLFVRHLEEFADADHVQQGSIDNYKRTTERAVLQDSAQLPDLNTVVFLAQIELGANGAIRAVDHFGRKTVPKAKDEIDGASIIARTITGDKLANGAVNDLKLATGSVKTEKLGNLQVTREKLGFDAVDDTRLANGAVTSSKIADNAVQTDKIADGAVTSTKLADGNVTDTKLAESSVKRQALAMTGTTDTTQNSLGPGLTREATLTVNSSVPQFLFVSVSPITLGGVVSFTQRVARENVSTNNNVTFTVTFKNEGGVAVSFRARIQTFEMGS